MLWDGESRNLNGISETSADDHFLYFENVQAGHYDFSVIYNSPAPSFSTESLLYPTGFAREDSSTSGNWPSVYGQDGYVLFDYDGTGNDRRDLPSYISSVHPSAQKNGCRHLQVAVATIGPRTPAPGRSGARTRNVGQLYTGDPIACQQTMTVDVQAAADKQYQVTLYILDGDRQARRQTVAVFDLKTLNRLALVHFLRNFAEGKYLSYTCSGSLRFRIDQVRGENAVLNAIFFDPMS